MTTYKTILVEVKDGIATLTFNRPDKLNTVNFEVLEEVEQAIKEFEKNPATGVMILTGAGEKSFAAGSDISLLATFDSAQGIHYAEVGHKALNKIQNCSKPVIAAINGYALGSGFEIILACHIRIASENSKFGLPEVGLGLIPGHGGTQRLARIIGIGYATDLILTGRTIDAQEALRIGLVTAVVTLTELRQSAEAIGQMIQSKSRTAIKTALKAINVNFEMALQDGLRYEAAVFKECFTTQDFHEGTKAFNEKRKPKFTGK